MKRERDHDLVLDQIAMANCLMLLSCGGGGGGGGGRFDPSPVIASSYNDDDADDGHHRVFECKTCNRKFSSFQALGGHRASHKKPRPTAVAAAGLGDMHGLHDVISKPKTHECSICGVEFAIGQALGGHMRRHRSAATTLNSNAQNKTKTTTLSSGSDGSSCLDSDNQVHSSGENRKRVLLLDLNLTPLENDLI